MFQPIASEMIRSTNCDSEIELESVLRRKTNIERQRNQFLTNPIPTKSAKFGKAAKPEQSRKLDTRDSFEKALDNVRLMCQLRKRHAEHVASLVIVPNWQVLFNTKGHLHSESHVKNLEIEIEEKDCGLHGGKRIEQKIDGDLLGGESKTVELGIDARIESYKFVNGDELPKVRVHNVRKVRITPKHKLARLHKALSSARLNKRTGVAYLKECDAPGLNPGERKFAEHILNTILYAYACDKHSYKPKNYLELKQYDSIFSEKVVAKLFAYQLNGNFDDLGSLGREHFGDSEWALNSPDLEERQEAQNRRDSTLKIEIKRKPREIIKYRDHYRGESKELAQRLKSQYSESSLGTRPKELRITAKSTTRFSATNAQDKNP